MNSFEGDKKVIPLWIATVLGYCNNKVIGYDVIAIAVQLKFSRLVEHLSDYIHTYIVWECNRCQTDKILMYNTSDTTQCGTLLYSCNLVSTIHGKFWREKNWQIGQIVSYSPTFSSPIFTDTLKMYY